MNQVLRHSKRTAIAIIGGLVVIIGIILIPYPGPGWLILFAGLAILATEFEFAAKWLTWLKARYEIWKSWIQRQPTILQLLAAGLTGLVVLATLFLLNTFGLVDNLFELHKSWLHSPLST